MKDDGIGFEDGADKAGRKIDTTRGDNDGTKIFIRQASLNLVLPAADNEAAVFGEGTGGLENVKDMVAHGDGGLMGETFWNVN